MTSRTKRLAITLAIAGVLAALVIGSRRGSEIAPGEGAEDAAVAPGQPPPELPALPQVPRPGPGELALEGGVYDVAGQPVAAAEITAELELGPGVTSLAPGARAPEAAPEGDAGPKDAGADQGGLETTPVITAIADADGAFVLQGLEPGRYRLRVDAPGIFPSEVRFFDVPAPGVRLVVARKAEIAGVVLDVAGRPAADVQVSVAGEAEGVITARSDADGRFALSELQEGVFRVWALGSGAAAPAARIPRLGPGPFEDVTLRLAPAVTITGRVVDRASGQGIAAAVSLTATTTDEPPRHGRSGPDGIFRVVGVLPGRWSASAYAPGYVAAEAIELEAGGAYEPVIAMTAGATVAGRVVDGRGVPVAGAVISARGTGAGGRVLVAGEDIEHQRLRQALGLQAGPVEQAPRFVSRGELGVLLGPIPFPPPRGSAALRIASALRHGDGAAPELGPALEAASVFVTDEQGRFRLAGLEAGTYRLVATHAGYADALSKPVKLALGKTLEDVTLVMVPGVVLVGEVTNQRGEVVVGATITADALLDRDKGKDADGAARIQAVTGLDGRYSLGPIATDVVLRVTAVHHGDVERAVRLGALGAEREERTEDFVLAVADATLAGRVRDAMGFPVRGASVTLAGKGGPSLPRRATTDDAGRFALLMLPAGEHALTIEHPDFPAWKGAGTTEADADITLPFGGGLEGEVRDAHTGGPIDGARVIARGPGEARVEGAATARGEIALKPLAAGAWTLEASAPGYVARTERVDVPAGTRPGEVTLRDVRVALERGATVAGTVRDSYGRRVRAAIVTVGSARATTDENGAFRLRDVTTGEVTIQAERGDARGALVVPLRPGDELVTLEIALDGPVE